MNVVANCNELLNNMVRLACFASQTFQTLRLNCLHVILRQPMPWLSLVN